MVDDMPYIPFQRVKNWKNGDRITVDGNPGKIRDIAKFKSPGSGEPIASIGVEYDNEPGVIRLVDFDVHQLKNLNVDALISRISKILSPIGAASFLNVGANFLPIERYLSRRFIAQR